MLYYPDIKQGVQNLLDGLTEVIFVRANLLPGMAAQGLVDLTAFKVLAQVGFTEPASQLHIS